MADLDAYLIAQIVADYLDRRDDVASATWTEQNRVVSVVTQGGQSFSIEVSPSPVPGRA